VLTHRDKHFLFMPYWYYRNKKPHRSGAIFK